MNLMVTQVAIITELLERCEKDIKSLLILKISEMFMQMLEIIDSVVLKCLQTHWMA